MSIKNTKQFIEDAIEGGWDGSYSTYPLVTRIVNVKKGRIKLKYKDEEWDGTTTQHVNLAVEQILLDPKAWQAVGKTRGWEKAKFPNGEPRDLLWSERWLDFIEYLIEGKTIEEALGEIT